MSENTTKIIIKRTSQWTNKLRGIEIYLNGKNIGVVRNGEEKEFDILSGTNELYTKIDWCKTEPLKLMTSPGETKQFELGSNIKGSKMLLALYYILFNTKKFIYLKELQGK